MCKLFCLSSYSDVLMEVHVHDIVRICKLLLDVILPTASGSTLPVDELQRYLVLYVNQELSLSPPIPSRGKALYDVCSDTTNLW